MPSALPAGALEELILPTTKWLSRLQLTLSGNWPSSLGESVNRDRLMQWCHGAPGVVPLMLAAHKVNTFLLSPVVLEATFIRGTD